MPSDKKLLKRLAKMLKSEKKHRQRSRRSRTRSRSFRRLRLSSSDSERTPTPSPMPSPERQSIAAEPAVGQMELEEDVENNNMQETQLDYLAPFREALGEEYQDSIKFEGKIQEEIGKRWDHILVNGLTKEEREVIMKKYKLPENCKLLDAPILNEEVKTVITESSKIRDRSLEITQHQLGIATSIIGQVMSGLIENEDIDKFIIIKKLSDAAKLLNDLHYYKTKTRKLLVSPLLDKYFINFVEKVKRDEHLYGMDLASKIKTSQEIKKSSSTIKKNVPRVYTNKNVSKQRAAGNRQGPPQNQPRQHTRTPAVRGGLKNRMTQPPFHRSGQNQSRPERATPRHAYSRR